MSSDNTVSATLLRQKAVGLPTPRSVLSVSPKDKKKRAKGSLKRPRIRRGGESHSAPPKPGAASPPRSSLQNSWARLRRWWRSSTTACVRPCWFFMP